MSGQYTHYGAMFSLYSAKTRAYLSYKRIPFVETYDGVELAGPIRDTTHKVMIPVVKCPDGEILQDTTVIIDTLEGRHTERPVFPEDPVLLLVSRLVEFIVDELWVSTAMNSRWNDAVSKQFAMFDFGNLIGGSLGMRGEAALGIGQKVAQKMQSFLPRLGVGDESGQALADRFFRRATHALNRAVGPGRFAFGGRPSFVDMCLHTAYYAHQYRDAGQLQIMMKRETPDLCYFLDSMHAAHCLPDSGDLALSDAFVDYLQVIGPAGASFAQGLSAQLDALLGDATVGEVCERPIPVFEMTLEGEAFHRGASTFSAWKLQRVRDVYAGLSDSDAQRAAPLLEKIGWVDILSDKTARRFARRDYQIYLDAI